MTFRTMKIATDIPHSKRLWLIRHLLGIGVTLEGVKEMGATDAELKEVFEKLRKEVFGK